MSSKGSAGSVLILKRNPKDHGARSRGAHQGISWTKSKKRGSGDDEIGKRDQGRRREELRKIQIDHPRHRNVFLILAEQTHTLLSLLSTCTPYKPSNVLLKIR